MTSARISLGEVRTSRRSRRAAGPSASARRAASSQNTGAQRISGLAPGELPDQLLDRLEAYVLFTLLRSSSLDARCSGPFCQVTGRHTKREAQISPLGPGRIQSGDVEVGLLLRAVIARAAPWLGLFDGATRAEGDLSHLPLSPTGPRDRWRTGHTPTTQRTGRTSS